MPESTKSFCIYLKLLEFGTASHFLNRNLKLHIDEEMTYMGEIKTI